MVVQGVRRTSTGIAWGNVDWLGPACVGIQGWESIRKATVKGLQVFLSLLDCGWSAKRSEARRVLSPGGEKLDVSDT